MTKEKRERIISAIEEHNKNVSEENQLDVYEVFDAITDEEAENIIAQIESKYKN